MKARAEEEERARREEALHRRRAALSKDVENLRPRSEAWSPQTCPRLPTSQSGRHTHTTHTRRETGAQHGEAGAIDETEEPTERAPLGAPRSAGEGGSCAPTAITAAHEALASNIKAPTHVRGAWGRVDEEWVRKQDGVWTLQHSSSAGLAQQACKGQGCEADEHRQADAHRQVARGKSQEDSRQGGAGALGEHPSAGAGIGGQEGAGGRLEELLDKHREQQHLIQPLRSRSRRAGGGAGAAGRRLYGGDEPARNNGMSHQVLSHKPLILKSPIYSDLAQ
jgi:hypothetical protein